MGRPRASRGQASCRVARLRWPWLGQGAVERMAAKARLGLWQNPTSRKYWIIAGERPSLTGAKRQEIQDLLQKRVLVREQHSRIQVPPGGPTRRSLARSVHSSGVRPRPPGIGRTPPNLGGTFEKGIGVIREHVLDYFQTMMVPANRNWLVKLINSDLTDWSSE